MGTSYNGTQKVTLFDPVTSLPYRAGSADSSTFILNLSIQISSANDNQIIAAPPAGQEIVITSIRIQKSAGASGSTTSLQLKRGGILFERLVTTTEGSGVDRVFPQGQWLHLGNAANFEINLSNAESHDVSVAYFLA